MEILFYGFVLLIAVMFIASFVQTLLYPPVEISSAELPAIVKREMDKFFPAFRPTKVLFWENRLQYKLKGAIDGCNCKLEFDLKPDGDLCEVEFKDLSEPRTLENITKIPLAAVPQQVARIMNVFLADDASPIQNNLACSAMINRENAYKIDVHTTDFKYEFEITDSGRLVEFEKEKRRI